MGRKSGCGKIPKYLLRAMAISNRRVFISDALILGFNDLHLVEELLMQPLQVIVGGKLCIVSLVVSQVAA